MCTCMCLSAHVGTGVCMYEYALVYVRMCATAHACMCIRVRVGACECAPPPHLSARGRCCRPTHSWQRRALLGRRPSSPPRPCGPHRWRPAGRTALRPGASANERENMDPIQDSQTANQPVKSSSQSISQPANQPASRPGQTAKSRPAI